MAFGLNSEATALLKRLLVYIRPYYHVIVPAGGAIVIYALVTGMVPFFVGDVFEQFRDRALASAEESVNWVDALILPAWFVGIFAVRGIMNFLMIYGVSWVGRSAVRDLRRDLFRRYLDLPAAWYDRNSSGDLVSRLTFNTEQVAEAVSNSVAGLVRDCLLIVVMFSVMLYFSAELTIILSVVGPVVALLMSAMSRAFRRYSQRIQSSMGDVTRFAAQALQGHRVVKIFSGQQYEAKRFAEINRQNFRFHLRLVATRAFGDGLTQFVVILGVAVIGFLIFSGWLNEDVDSPRFTAFITAVGILLTSLKRLVGTNASLQRGIAAAGSLFEILDEPVEPDVDVTASADDKSAASVRSQSRRVRGEIELQDVSFRYGDEQEEVLHKVSLRVEPGETVAIVGRSGSGKSTLVSLLPRFYDVSSGAILLDGTDIRDYPVTDLRHQFSVVSQEVTLFDDTIAGNIAYGALAELPREQVEQAATAAYVSNFADELPDGLETQVGEAGALLSGGQRQRIAIARAILKDAPVLILDEATSALDSESEHHVQSALSTLMQGRTTLVIAHRLSTVEQADRIVVMRDGMIVETGRHEDLLAAAGYYANLYRLQFAD